MSERSLSLPSERKATRAEISAREHRARLVDINTAPKNKTKYHYAMQYVNITNIQYTLEQDDDNTMKTGIITP